VVKVKKKLEKRLAYLYSGELSSIIIFIFVSYLLNYAYSNLQLYSLYSFWVSFILLEFLLLQGTIYWYTKFKRLRNENTSITPIQTVRQLQRFKKLNIVLIIIPIIAFAFDFVKWYPSLPLGGLSIAGFVYIFAVLEYVNYFYVQLSYDNISDIKYLLKTKRLKQACISKDFKRIS
jgi:hypothetical protein